MKKLLLNVILILLGLASKTLAATPTNITEEASVASLNPQRQGAPAYDTSCLPSWTTINQLDNPLVNANENVETPIGNNKGTFRNVVGKGMPWMQVNRAKWIDYDYGRLVEFARDFWM